MTRLARALGRALLWVGVALIALGIATAGVALYLSSWPIRRLATRSSTGARVIALQELLVALAGAVAAFRATPP